MPNYVMSSTIPDLYLIFAGCWATWGRIKILMVIAIVLCIVNLALSGWLSQSSSGSMNQITMSDGSSYNKWFSQVCASSPYLYLRPFSFYLVIDGSVSSSLTSCGFPATNSIIRFVVGCMAIVSAAVLFFKTPLSMIARQIWAGAAFLYFTVFILDSNDTEIGSVTCKKTFPNTALTSDLANSNATLQCDSGSFAWLAVIDFMLIVCLFVLHSAWGMTRDLYVTQKKKPGK
jgi:hypothetical protein